jgi:hypothetical protein
MVTFIDVTKKPFDPRAKSYSYTLYIEIIKYYYIDLFIISIEKLV